MEIRKVLIVGSGTMGSGIAQWFAQQGIEAYLSDVKKDIALAGYKKVNHSWEKLAKKGKFTEEEVESFRNNLTPVETNDAPEDIDLVIEAIVEDLSIKTKLFQDLDEKYDSNVIFSSNTSSIPISSMAKELPLERRKNFLGLHFFNPAPIMKLVEVIKGHDTSTNLADKLYTFFNNSGKKAALCKDRPGFIVNRVARNFYGESFRILESYDQARVEEIDHVMKEVGGFRMGPFELMDLIGIDVNYDVTNSVWDAFFKEPRFAPHSIQKDMVDSGRIGKKAGAGFYSYDQN